MRSRGINKSRLMITQWMLHRKHWHGQCERPHERDWPLFGRFRLTPAKCVQHKS